MCTNGAIVNSLECYMDDLVDCFEDFVKKSLILISVGVGTIVVMLVYMLKVLNDRTGSAVTASDTRRNLLQSSRSNTSLRSSASKSSSKRSSVKGDFMLQSSTPKLTSTSANTMAIPPSPSYDEKILRDIGFANYNKKFESRRPKRSASRISIPSLPTSTCSPKRDVSKPRNCQKTLKRTSCCSLCCADDKLIQ